MEIVVNEWILDYLCPSTDRNKTLIAKNFVNAWVRRCDKVVIGDNTPFVHKFYRYMKRFGNYTEFKQDFKKLHELLFINSDKTIIVSRNDIGECPQAVAELVPDDDKYLIALASNTTDKLLVTTDETLKQRLDRVSGLKIELVVDFLQNYS